MTSCCGRPLEPLIPFPILAGAALGRGAPEMYCTVCICIVNTFLGTRLLTQLSVGWGLQARLRAAGVRADQARTAGGAPGASRKPNTETRIPKFKTDSRKPKIEKPDTRNLEPEPRDPEPLKAHDLGRGRGNLETDNRHPNPRT